MAAARGIDNDEGDADGAVTVLEGEALSVLTIVPKTRCEDTVLYCLPMIAPYTGLTKVPFKVSCYCTKCVFRQCV